MQRLKHIDLGPGHIMQPLYLCLIYKIMVHLLIRIIEAIIIKLLMICKEMKEIEI